MVNDWFRAVRDAVAAVFAQALSDAGVSGVRVKGLDKLNLNAVDQPAVLVVYNGSEQATGGTNARDDYGYPVQLALFTLETDDGASGTDDPPGITPTAFRQLVRERFHHRRAVSVAGIDCFVCEYDPLGAVFDESNEAYQLVKCLAVVTVYARVPRGGV